MESLSSWVLGKGLTGSSLVAIVDKLSHDEVSDRGDFAAADEFLVAKNLDQAFHVAQESISSHISALLLKAFHVCLCHLVIGHGLTTVAESTILGS